MKIQELKEILERQFRYHQRIQRMSLDQIVARFVKATVLDLERVGVPIEHERDIDVLDFPRLLVRELDEMEDDGISRDEEKLIEKLRPLLNRVKE